MNESMNELLLRWATHSPTQVFSNHLFTEPLLLTYAELRMRRIPRSEALSFLPFCCEKNRALATVSCPFSSIFPTLSSKGPHSFPTFCDHGSHYICKDKEISALRLYLVSSNMATWEIVVKMLDTEMGHVQSKWDMFKVNEYVPAM